MHIVCWISHILYFPYLTGSQYENRWSVHSTFIRHPMKEKRNYWESFVSVLGPPLNTIRTILSFMMRKWLSDCRSRVLDDSFIVQALNVAASLRVVWSSHRIKSISMEHYNGYIMTKYSPPFSIYIYTYKSKFYSIMNYWQILEKTAKLITTTLATIIDPEVELSKKNYHR